MLYAYEEFGLSGAREYAKAYESTIDKHIVGLESDFGAGRVWRLSGRLAETALPWVAALHRQLSDLGIEPGDKTTSGGADLGRIAKEQ